ncbi:alpha/beta fold hydrolase [Filibacter tadaridae]|uniref:Non-heme bromoperoxidase BpoC n=1 Tax=Filibacter tadaridae TaxID=2483811 RepID=A0A3P5X5K1_9BACL|nr:alpha/beta fold hydrolase [Filibacter tadaridae]VDC29479.1 Putative non-heme bromoperoxidase BpoC [Filibacter tadaridae]
MPTFNSNGVNLYYEDTGIGKPLLLLHGLTSNHAMFYRENEIFKETYRVITMDARGHGNSDKPTHYTLDDHVQDTIALLNHLELDAIYLIGVSMGSYIAQGLAIEMPSQVEKLVLVSTKSHGEQSSMAELFARHAAELKGLNIVDKMSHASQYMFYNQTTVGKWLHETAKNGNQLTLSEQDIASKALEGFDFRKKLGNISAETLVISGRHDGLNPPEYGRETAILIPEATFMEFKWSGHAPNVEQPDLFIGIVENFFE